jgi:hypothetical protein
MQKKRYYFLFLVLFFVSFLAINSFAARKPILNLFSTKTATETFVVFKDQSLPYTGSQEYLEYDVFVDGYKTLHLYWYNPSYTVEGYYLQVWFEVIDPLTGEYYREASWASLTSDSEGTFTVEVKGSILKIRIYNYPEMDETDTCSLVIYAQGS